VVVRYNHYVPTWYQKGFLDVGQGELHVLDKNPEKTLVLPNGDIKIISSRPFSRRGPFKFLRHLDLYTTTFLGAPNDEIERRLFGKIDDTGARAAAMFQNWPNTKRHDFHNSIPRKYGDPNKHFTAMIEYIDAQKIRTPKGLRFLKLVAARTGAILQQNALMSLMQSQRMFFCTMLAEGFWEIVGANESKQKFVFSDDPVTIYNCDHYPGSQMCQYPLDPHIFERGTRVVLPLNMNACLIISHIEHAKEPSRGKARQRRRNARAYDQTIISFLHIHRRRELNDREVATINYLIKRRAPRFVAAGQSQWLTPEALIGEPRWCEIDDTLQHKEFAMKLAGGEILVKYQDDSILSSNEYGEHSVVPGWFVRQRQRKDSST